MRQSDQGQQQQGYGYPQQGYGYPQQGQQQQQQGYGYPQQQGGGSQQQQSSSGDADTPLSLNGFVHMREHHDSGHTFHLENPRMMAVKVDGHIWMKMGTMAAYSGDIKFKREGIAENGLGKMIMRKVTKENVFLNKAEGRGTMYVADNGKNIQILALDSNQSLYVQSYHILAFEPSVDWDITTMKSFAGYIEGGLFAVKFKGPGNVAITTFFDPIVLTVSSDRPICTDPGNTVAWSGNLTPSVRTDITWKNFVGRGSGESIQMEFRGDSGFVVVQPYHFLTHLPH